MSESLIIRQLFKEGDKPHTPVKVTVTWAAPTYNALLSWNTKACHVPCRKQVTYVNILNHSSKFVQIFLKGNLPGKLMWVQLRVDIISRKYIGTLFEISALICWNWILKLTMSKSQVNFLTSSWFIQKQKLSSKIAAVQKWVYNTRIKHIY